MKLEVITFDDTTWGVEAGKMYSMEQWSSERSAAMVLDVGTCHRYWNYKHKEWDTFGSGTPTKIAFQFIEGGEVVIQEQVQYITFLQDGAVEVGEKLFPYEPVTIDRIGILYGAYDPHGKYITVPGGQYKIVALLSSGRTLPLANILPDKLKRNKRDKLSFNQVIDLDLAAFVGTSVGKAQQSLRQYTL